MIRIPRATASALLLLALVPPATASAAEPPGLRAAIRRHELQVEAYRHRRYDATIEKLTPAQFHFALVDLNHDGIVDAIVLFDGSHDCGTGGCRMEIYRGTPGGFVFLSRSTITRAPIRVASERSHGWSTLIVHSGGTDDVLMRFNGKRYPLNPSLQARATKHQIETSTGLIN